MEPREPAAQLAIHPLTPERFADLEQLFGRHGASGGCWCMWWRLSRQEYRAGKGEGNRRALRALVEDGRVPGLLAYHGDRPVGWIAVEPRSAYPRLAASRDLSPVDAAPVWSVTCFYVARGWRRRGVTGRLLAAAAAHALGAGAALLEAYPREPREGAAAPALYTGVASTFHAQGFEEVARRAPGRPILRLALSGRRASPARARGPGRSRPRSSPRHGSASRPGR